MKNWTIAALFGMTITQFGTGCILYDDGNDTIEPSGSINQFIIEMNLLSGDNNDLVDCPTDVAEVQMVILDDANKETVERFACDGKTLVSGEIPEGVYGVYINLITDNANSDLYAQSEVVEGNKFSANNPAPIKLPIDISIDRGSFEIAWKIQENMQNMVEKTCADLQSDKVDVVSLDSTNTMHPDSFACTDGVNQTGALPLDSYTISLSFKDNGALIGAPIQKTGDLIFGNQFNRDVETFVMNIQ